MDSGLAASPRPGMTIPSVIPAERYAREPESIIRAGATPAPLVVMDSGFAASPRPGAAVSPHPEEAAEAGGRLEG